MMATILTKRMAAQKVYRTPSAAAKLLPWVVPPVSSRKKSEAMTTAFSPLNLSTPALTHNRPSVLHQKRANHLTCPALHPHSNHLVRFALLPAAPLALVAQLFLLSRIPGTNLLKHERLLALRRVLRQLRALHFQGPQQDRVSGRTAFLRMLHPGLL